MNWRLLAIVLILLLFFTYPGVLHLNSRLIGGGGDTYQFLGFQSLVTTFLSQSKFPFRYTDLWRFPVGFDFSRGYDSVSANLFGGFLGVMIKNQVLAYNLTVLLFFFFNCIFSYWFFKKVSRSEFASIFGAVIYGFSFYNLARGAGHVGLLFSGVIPLACLMLISIYEKQTWRNFFALELSLILLSLTAIQYLLMMVLLFFLVIGILLITKKLDLNKLLKLFWKNIFKVVVTTSSFLTVFIIFYRPHILALLKNQLVKKAETDLSPFLSDWILPNKHLSGVMFSWANPSPISVERVVFMGWLEMMMFGLFLFYYKHKYVKKFILAVFVIFFVFSMGFSLPSTNLKLPYGYLIKTFPFFIISDPSRFIVIAYLFLVLGVVFFIKSLKNNLKQNKWLFFAIFLIVILERISWHGYFSTPILEGKFSDVVSNLPGKAVMDIPLLDERDSYHSFIYKKSVVGGLPHWSTDTDKARSFITENGEITRFICNQGVNITKIPFETGKKEFYLQQNTAMLQRLKANGIKTIVVHKDYKIYWDECNNVLSQTTLLLPRFSIISDSKKKQLLVLRRFQNSSMNYQLYFPRGGTFSLFQMQFAMPRDSARINYWLNGQEIFLDTNKMDRKEIFEYGRWQKWIFSKNNQPMFTIQVKSGSILKISNSYVFKDKGFLNIWYEFKEDKQSKYIKPPVLENGLKKIYEDENKEVFTID